MPVNQKAELVKKEQLKPDIFKFTLKSKEIAQSAKPGNFLEIRVSDNVEPFLRRPISIHNVEKEKEQLQFIFQVKGKGTQILSEKKEGDLIDVIGPLGYGTFEVENYKNAYIIGGGIGTFPLYELAKRLHENQCRVNLYMGFRSKEFVQLEQEFKGVCDKVVITTNDGSYGEKGYATDALVEDIEKVKPDIIFSCGPLPMLKSVRKIAMERDIPCQISLEERMGCGIGACLGCAVKVISGDEPRYGHVCKEGPVFYADEVEI